MKKYILLFLVIVLFSSIYSQDTTRVAADSSSAEPAPVQKEQSFFHKVRHFFEQNIFLGILLTIGSICFGIYQYMQRFKDTRKKTEIARKTEWNLEDQKNRSAEEISELLLLKTYKEKFGKIQLVGAPGIDSVPVNLIDTFVTLSLSDTWRAENQFKPECKAEIEREHRILNAKQVMQRAFDGDRRLLLVIGDPGSGKTTLLKHYTMCCIENNTKELGFVNPVLPLFFPLRELKWENGEPASLNKQLHKWAERHEVNISAEIFYQWMQKRNTFILLDGLDEVSEVAKRRKVCRWIADIVAGLGQARFVVTSRWTGYQKLDGIEIPTSLWRADVRPFSPQQQKEFLQKWFQAVTTQENILKSKDQTVDVQTSEKKALKDADAIYGFLYRKENQNLQELAATPLLLQIMAIIWREKKFLPHHRFMLYSLSLNYLLEFRDLVRELKPLIPAHQAVQVLAPVSYWMQEKRTDSVKKQEIYKKIQPILNTFAANNRKVTAHAFCENLRDRAGLIVDPSQDECMFRHKSFREYFSALYISDNPDNPQLLCKLVNSFGDDWWEEVLRFYINQCNADRFDIFMSELFKAKISRELSQTAQNLLQTLISEAQAKKITALVDFLNSKKTNENQKRYILESLRSIGTKEALAEIARFAQKRVSEGKAAVIFTGGKDRIIIPPEKQKVKNIFTEFPDSFYNPWEENAEYIRISGGSYTFSVNKKQVTVPDTYFARHPVTNRQYRRFIAFLNNELNEKKIKLTVDLYLKVLANVANTIKGFSEYIPTAHDILLQRFAIKEDNKRFLSDEQPVVGVCWYNAVAYCLWLTLLEAASQKPGENIQIEHLASFYRLPHEREWEWAAAGREPDGLLRPYPWPKQKGKPTKLLANYEKMVGTTTPIGRYPDGATPEGLMDMAGNVWEWQANKYESDRPWPALRGGSWYNNADNLRCSARNNNNPDNYNNNIGFRVVRSQSC
ncbi:SUMF1/EgtB/PvdO family nonheme iron enzyme [candidate division KSB1 bacterium]|nr:SUMF1/EgtB/PvdO family nonheme iron enzyme [candidate division KSB1 bacterium]